MVQLFEIEAFSVYEGDKDAAQELARDIRHLANIGRLWGVIVIGSFLAFFAELFELLIDHHVL